MQWFERDFNHPLYFKIYQDKEEDASREGPALADLLGLPPGKLVLDLPCGWGRLRPSLMEKGHTVVGGDLSPLNLARHQEKHPGSLVRLDLRHLPFLTSCADGVFCAFTSWGYFATDEENLAQLLEFFRVLTPGGILLLDLAGRKHLEQASRRCGNVWYEAEGGYRERVRWSHDKRRIFTDRLLEGEHFRHDIWIPTLGEALEFLEKAGFLITHAYGSLKGEPWSEDAERWIFRATKPS